MATSNRVYLHQMDPPPPSAPSALPPWLASSSMTPTIRPPSSPSVTLTLLPTIIPPAPPIPWLQQHDNPTQFQSVGGNHLVVSELMNCCRELDEGQRAWEAHRKEAGWRLKRVELQLESEKAARRKDKMDEIEAKVKALKEEQRVALDRIETEYREQLAGLRREAEVKEQKLAEQWAAKHLRLSMFLEQHMGCRQIGSEPNGR